MSSIYLLLATLLLCSTCFAAESQSVSNEAAELEFISWLDAVAKRPLISPIYWGMFRVRYPRYEVQLVTGNVLSFYGKKHRLRINDDTKTIHVADQNLAINVLEHFGRAIRKLYISSDFSKAILENMTQPLRVAALRMDIKQNLTDVHPLNVLFPEVEELSLRLESNVDYSYLNCVLPNLLSLDISMTKESWRRKEQIEGLIWENKHVKAIEFSGFPANYIKTINRLVPSVEILTLHGFDTANETIQFDNVKHLTIYGENGQSGSPGTIEQLLCPTLKSLEFFYSPSDFKAWRTFFRNHPDLLIISLRESRIQDYRTFEEGVQLMQLISTELNLLTFKMHNSNFIPLDMIKKFVETHPKLKLFHITSTPKTSEIMVVRLQSGQWQICVLQDDQVVFAGDYDEYEKLMKQSMQNTKRGKEVDYDD